MTRLELEKYLNKIVEIKLFDNDIVSGCLRKSGTELFKDDPDLYYRKNFYFFTKDINSLTCTSCLFRVSHIKSLRVIS